MEINIEEFYRKYGPMVLRRCRSLLKDEELALDAMQEVFVKVLNKQKQLRADAVSSLLYTIASNTCLNILRDNKNKAMNNVDEHIQQIAAYDDTENRILAKFFLNDLFAQEKHSTKVIALLHYIDQLTLQETADAVGLSVSGVRKRLRNLRKSSLKLQHEEKEYV